MTLEQNDIKPKTLRVNDAAEYTSIAKSTLEKLRLTGGGPNYIKIGKSVVYLISDLDEWLEGNRRNSTSEVK